MSKTRKLSDMDPSQITRATHDESLNAQRVTLVGLDNLVIEPKIDFSSLSLPKQESPEIRVIETKVPVVVTETRIERIEVPVILVREKIVEVPRERLVFQDKVQMIEVPVFTKEVEYREIQVPVITERLKDDKVLKLFQVIQSLAVLGILIKLLLK